MDSRVALTLLVATLLGCAAPPEPATPTLLHRHYPEAWWRALPEGERHAWEIPPQAAGPGEVIVSKRNELGLLSNFAPTPFELHDRRFASLEGFWQAMKYPEDQDDPRAAPVDSEGRAVVWPHARAEVEQLTAFEAHTAGVEAEALMQRLGVDWVSYRGERLRFKDDPVHIDRHHALIVEATWAKVRQNPDVRRVLLSTGDLVLRPDHHEDADGTKAWRYCTIWMEIRRELQRE